MIRQLGNTDCRRDGRVNLLSRAALPFINLGNLTARAFFMSKIRYNLLMSDNGYLPGIGIATAMTLAAWLLVLFYFDPTTSGIPGVVLFFISFTATLIGISILIFSYFRYRFSKLQATFGVTVRQAVLLGLVVSGILLLLALGKLNWWNGAAIIVVGLVIESFYLVKSEE
jgi:hypothetical protein